MINGVLASSIKTESSSSTMVVMFGLNQIGRGARHIISEVVKTEFIVGSICNVCQINFSSLCAVGFMIIDTIYTHAVKLKQRAHQALSRLAR